MKYLLLVLFVAFLACKENSSSGESSWKDGQFTAQFLNKTYEDEIRYYLGNTDGLTVYSDKNDIEDSDGDGLIVALFQTGDEIQLDLVDNGVRYGGQITNWQQTKSEITGSGEMKEESNFQNHNISFTLKLDN